MNEYFETKDKQITPYLLTRQDIEFHGIVMHGPMIFFRFTPHEVASAAANQFISRQANPVEPKTLLDAVESYRDIVFQMKEKRNSYGIHQ